MAAGIRQQPEVSGVSSSKPNLVRKALPLAPEHESTAEKTFCTAFGDLQIQEK